MAKKNPIAAAAKKMAAAPVSNNTVEAEAAVKEEGRGAEEGDCKEDSGKENNSKGHQDIRSCTVRRQGSCRERSHRGC